MNFRRHLNIKSIKLNLEVQPLSAENVDPLSKANIRHLRREILHELVELFAETGQISNKKKLLIDLLNREKRASTGLEYGIAFPHVRTIQARSFIMAFARSSNGILFNEDSHEPYNIFFGIVAPPYDDKRYLQVYRTLLPLLLDKKWRNQLLKAEDPHEILKLLKPSSR